MRTRRRDHNRVEPGDAFGIAIRVHPENFRVVVDLLGPDVPEQLVLRQRDYVTIYATIGRDNLNGRVVPHRWVNVVTEPPPGLTDGPSTAEGLGGIACIGARSSPICQMWWRQGLGRVPGRLQLVVDRRAWRASARITTAGGTLTTDATFDASGEPWTALPMRYVVLTTDPPRLLTGHEWGTRHDGSGRVAFVGPRGRVRFDTYVGLDLDLGWDYLLDAGEVAPRGPGQPDVTGQESEKRREAGGPLADTDYSRTG